MLFDFFKKNLNFWENKKWNFSDIEKFFEKNHNNKKLLYIVIDKEKITYYGNGKPNRNDIVKKFTDI